MNPDYVERIESGGLKFVGKDDTGDRMEARQPAPIQCLLAD